MSPLAANEDVKARGMKAISEFTQLGKARREAAAYMRLNTCVVVIRRRFVKLSPNKDVIIEFDDVFHEEHAQGLQSVKLIMKAMARNEHRLEISVSWKRLFGELMSVTFPVARAVDGYQIRRLGIIIRCD